MVTSKAGIHPKEEWETASAQSAHLVMIEKRTELMAVRKRCAVHALTASSLA